LVLGIAKRRNGTALLRRLFLVEVILVAIKLRSLVGDPPGNFCLSGLYISVFRLQSLDISVLALQGRRRGVGVDAAAKRRNALGICRFFSGCQATS
jgi:hypothetical protein